MPHIHWAGIIHNTSEFPDSTLPVTAKQLKEPASIGKLLTCSLPFLFPSILLLFLSMFFKTYLYKARVISPLAAVIGIGLGALLLLVHEYLHAIVYPKEAHVAVGIFPKLFAAVVLVSYPLSKKRFILMSLLPLVLGLVPLACFWILPGTYHFLNGVCFGLATMGLTSPYPDFYYVYQVIKQVPKHAKVQNSGTHTYWFL